MFTPMATNVPMNTPRIRSPACCSGCSISGNAMTMHRNTIAARLAVSGFPMSTAVYSEISTPSAILA